MSRTIRPSGPRQEQNSALETLASSRIKITENGSSVNLEPREYLVIGKALLKFRIRYILAQLGSISAA